jgi:hypothetical protein
MFSGNEAQVALDCVSVGKPLDAIERSYESQRRHGPNSWNRHEALADRVLACQALELCVGHSDALAERFDDGELMLDEFR